MRTILVILVIPASLLVTAPPVHAAAVYCGGEIATIVGTDASETIYGTSERDVIYAAGGADRIFGGPLPDPCYDDNGDDLICGGLGNDTIEGDAGRDRLIGGAGNDSMRVPASISCWAARAPTTWRTITRAGSTTSPPGAETTS